MQPIRSRTDLIDAALRLCPLPACARAIREGQAENLGGFMAIPLGPTIHRQGWILRVTSRHGRTWLLAILIDPTARAYFATLVERIPWETWANVDEGVYAGDNPAVCRADRAAYLGSGACDPQAEGGQ